MSTIIIVEDEPKLAALMADYLRASGFAAWCIANGLEVVPWVCEHSPDLILLDLMLPGRDGLEICRELRGFSDVPVVMVTAKVEEIDRLVALEFGADDYEADEAIDFLDFRRHHHYRDAAKTAQLAADHIGRA